MLHFKMNRDVFKSQLVTTSKAIESKTTMPILTGVKIELTDDHLSMTGSNVDISIITETPLTDEAAEISSFETGGIVLDAAFLLKIISVLPDNTFEFETLENMQVHITSGKAEYYVNGLDIDNYPRLPDVTSDSPLSLPNTLLKSLIHETAFAVSKQESKPILTGVHLQLEGEELKAVATDSHRLSQRKLQLDEATTNFDIIVPGKSLQHVSSIFGELEDNLEIHIANSQVMFQAGGIQFYSRLLEGNYPDTDRLIPDSGETVLVFETSEIASAINRASLMSHEGQNNIVRFEITKDGVQLFGNSPEIGRFDEALVVKSVSGNDLKISFNPDYMKEALRVFGKGEVEVTFNSPIRPFTLRPVEQNGEFVQLITPVRTA